MSTQQRSAAPSEHRRITGCPGESHFSFPISGLFAIRESVQPFQIIPYSGTSSPDDLGISGNEGKVSRRCSSISVSLHAWTLPSRTPTATRFRLCPTLSGELFRRRTHAVPPTYSLGTVADQTATVQHKHCQQGILHRTSSSVQHSTSGALE